MEQQHGFALKIVCGVIIIAFFLQWISLSYGGVSTSASAFDIVVGGGSMLTAAISGFIKLLLLTIPVATGCILYYYIKKEGRYPIPKVILFNIPAVVTVIFFLALSSKVTDIRNLTLGFGDAISVTDILGRGFWLSLPAAAYMAFLSLDKKSSPNVPTNLNNNEAATREKSTSL